MVCYFCGGNTEPAIVTDLHAGGGAYVAIENVPAGVCRQCGERYYSAFVTQRLLELTRAAHGSVAAGSRAQFIVQNFAVQTAPALT